MIRLLSCNIRCDYEQDGENCFRFRKELLKKAVLDRQPDVICFQEVLPHVAAWLKQELTGYYVVGCGRDTCLRNEQTSIAYRFDRFNLVTLDTFWLSPSPETPGSRFEDQSDCPRVCSAAVLEDFSDGTLYRIASVHLDHIGAKARKDGLNVLLDRLEHSESFRDAHIILAGDFNDLPESSCFDAFAAHPGYRDAAAASGGTWHDFGRRVPADKIDYVFTRDLKGCGVNVWADCRDGVWLSDHYPVEVCLEA